MMKGARRLRLTGSFAVGKDQKWHRKACSIETSLKRVAEERQVFWCMGFLLGLKLNENLVALNGDAKTHNNNSIKKSEAEDFSVHNWVARFPLNLNISVYNWTFTDRPVVSCLMQ